MTYVPYYRVSTAGQGKSGLGLSAQQDIVQRFLKGDDVLLSDFIKVESGKRADGPQLAAAIAQAKRHKARLLIAKLDRLSRNLSFTFSLRNAEVDFVACDIPDANTLTVEIMAVLAQHERELIGERTQAALAAKKAQGYKLGMPNRQLNAQTNLANRRAAKLIRLYRKDGLTDRPNAERLNQMGYRTRRGQEFFAISVIRLDGKP